MAPRSKAWTGTINHDRKVKSMRTIVTTGVVVAFGLNLWLQRERLWQRKQGEPSCSHAEPKHVGRRDGQRGRHQRRAVVLTESSDSAGRGDDRVTNGRGPLGGVRFCVSLSFGCQVQGFEGSFRQLPPVSRRCSVQTRSAGRHRPPIGAVHKLGVVAPPVHLEEIDLPGIELRPDVAGDVGIWDQRSVDEPAHLVAAAEHAAPSLSANDCADHLGIDRAVARPRHHDRHPR